MRYLGLGFLVFALTACYSAASVRQAGIVYSADSERMPVEIGECIRNQYLLRHDYPLEMAVDERTGLVRVTSVSRGTYHAPIYTWEVTITPVDGSGSRIEVRSNSSMWGPFITDFDLIEGCSAAGK